MRSLGLLLVALILLAGCGEPEDSTQWILWGGSLSKKVLIVGEKPGWQPLGAYRGRAKCEEAWNKLESSLPKSEDFLQLHECWPTGTAPSK